MAIQAPIAQCTYSEKSASESPTKKPDNFLPSLTVRPSRVSPPTKDGQKTQRKEKGPSRLVCLHACVRTRNTGDIVYKDIMVIKHNGLVSDINCIKKLRCKIRVSPTIMTPLRNIFLSGYQSCTTATVFCVHKWSYFSYWVNLPVERQYAHFKHRFKNEKPS